MPFSSLGLSEILVNALIHQKYIEPYPIQEQAIPAILEGKDVLGIAQTGSGKTISYVLPILQLLQQRPAAKNRHIQVLVLVPTRELSVQVCEVFQLYSQVLTQRIKTMAVFGGVSINPQMINMQGVDVLVATPGRLLDLISAKAVYLSNVEIIVLDEADKMLNLGFEEEMAQVFKLLPSKRQNLLFSATLENDVNAITELLLHNPIKIKIEAEKQNLDLINQIAYSVEDERKGPFLRYLIKQQDMQQVLVFVSSIHKADAVVSKLKINGIQAEAMHSQKSQGARTEALRKFKTGKLRVLVATDIMSRGIDIPFLPFVINYELPRSPKDYIHRIGRTGRAENPGEAISLINYDEQHHFVVIQRKIHKRVSLIHTDEIVLRGF
ncbi:MAG: DEAD/DEAH box helicase [Bacteroidota bacterium]